MSNMFFPVHDILQVMVMGGLGEEHSVMKLVLGQNNWYSVPPMSFPRVQVIMMTVMMITTKWKKVGGDNDRQLVPCYNVALNRAVENAESARSVIYAIF